MVEIRLAEPADRPGLIALDAAGSPRWPVSIVRTPVDGGRLLDALLPGTRRYVALAPDGVSIAGTTAISIAPTQVDGDLVLGAYFWGSRVHPAFRGQGIGSALTALRWEEARAAGVRIGWGIAERSNEASARIYRRLGFRVDRTIPTRLIPPGWHVARRPSGVVCRAAAAADLAATAEALNAHYARHQLWWPLTASRLRQEAAALGAPDANLLVASPADGGPSAAAGVAVLRHAIRLSRPGGAGSRSIADRLLGPPASVQLLRYAMLPGESAAAGAALVGQLQRRHLRRALVLAANLDRLDPAWPACASLPGLTLALDLWVNAPQPLASGRPCWIT